MRKKAVSRLLMGSAFVLIVYFIVLQPFLYPTLRIRDFFSSHAREITLNEGRKRNLSFLPLHDPVITPRGFNNSRFLVVILVPSSPMNVQKRNAIRKTWGRRENWNFAMKRVLIKHAYRTTFVIGTSSSENIAQKIRKEITANHDILLGNFTDSYKSLNIKVFMALKWSLSIDCQYVLKADDDVYVNVPLLSSWLLKNSKISKLSKNLYSGHVHWRVTPIRNDSSKHFLTKRLYPRQVFPPYCGGPAYILSRVFVSRILNASRVILPLWIEDAYMGMLAYYVGVSPLHHKGFHLRYNNVSSKELQSLKECFLSKTFIYGHELGANELFHIHDKVRRMNSRGNDQLGFQCLLKDLAFAMGVVVRFLLFSFTGIVICVGVLKWIRWTLAKRATFIYNHYR